MCLGWCHRLALWVREQFCTMILQEATEWCLFLEAVEGEETITSKVPVVILMEVVCDRKCVQGRDVVVLGVGRSSPRLLRGP